MEDIRDRLRDIEKTDRHCKAGKSLAYRPLEGDDMELIGALVEGISGTDDPVNLTDTSLLRNEFFRLREHVIKKETSGNPDSQVGGIRLRMTSKEVLVSVPDAPNEIRCQDLLRAAETKIMSDYSM